VAALSRRRITEQYDKELLDTSTWPNVNLNSLSEQDLYIYRKRKKAIEMFISGEPIKEIYEVTGIQRKEVNAFFNNCIKEEVSGNIFGFRALIPGKTIKEYTRNEFPSLSKRQSQQKSGCFKLLMDTYPTLQDLVDSLFFKKNNRGVNEPVIKKKEIHRKFIKACRELGLKPPDDYPFNTKELARRSLYNYLTKLEERNMTMASERYTKDKNNINTHFYEQSPNQLKPYERVQFDGHRIDLSISITFETPSGDEVTKEMDRLWLLVIIDVATSAILGYHISLNKEYNSNDVLQCIKKSIEPWEPLQFEIPGLKYPDGSGIPSGVIEETSWALWDEFYYDNARANLSKIVKDRLKRIVNCRINAGPAKSPTKRALIERFFGILEENGYHRMINTTGSNPKDPRRNEPEKNAIKYQISIEELEQLTDYLIAEYNSTPNEGKSFSTPLESMRYRIKKDPIIRQIPIESRDDIPFFCIEGKREIKGDIKDGRRPYINFENVRYTNELLLRSPGLIGKTLTLVINIDDIRFITAYLPDGSEFGKLIANGYWGKVKHSLALRKEIFKLRNKKLLHFTLQDDAIGIYHQFLREKAVDIKRYRNKLGSMEKYLNDENHQSHQDTRVKKEVDNNNIKNQQEQPYDTKGEVYEFVNRSEQKTESRLEKNKKLFRKTIIRG
jgi:putative transposase